MSAIYNIVKYMYFELDWIQFLVKKCIWLFIKRIICIKKLKK